MPQLTLHFKFLVNNLPLYIVEDKTIKCVPYACVVGNSLYAMVCTNSNISQASSVVSRFIVKSRNSHYEEVKWILRYLKCTINTSLCIGGDICQISEFVDLDYVGDLDITQSTTKYVFKIMVFWLADSCCYNLQWNYLL